MGRDYKCVKILGREPELKRQLRRPGHSGEDNITKDLRERVGEDVEWLHLAQGGDQWQAVVNTVMNLQSP
jgi:ribosome biogenesis protein Nip4